MLSWDLPEDVRKTMEMRLRDDLASDPVVKLTRVSFFGENLNVFSFTIPEPPQANETYIFMFHFLYADDEKTLRMIDADWQPPDSSI